MKAIEEPGYAGFRPTVARLIDSRFWLLCLDVYPALVAASIPWSTTAVSGFCLLWLVVLIPTIELTSLSRLLRRPACWLPLAFFALALVGTLWAQDPWQDRLLGLKPVLKFLMVPLLFYHFDRSKRGAWVLWAFVASCAFLEFFSWVVILEPQWSMSHTDVVVPGVPVKNSIDQSYELVLCIFVTAPFTLKLLKEKRLPAFSALAFLTLAIFVTLAFVVTSRTALVYFPILAAVFLARYVKLKTTILLLAVAGAAVTMTWFASPYLRFRVEQVRAEYLNYQHDNPYTSAGMRLTWWHESLEFFASAPLLGHGTGSIKGLMNKNGVERTGVSSGEIRNPHNQTLYVAVQWGLLGCLLLYAMWLCHLVFFFGSGVPAWIGLAVVVQNIVGSFFNSHLFDFTEGWIYVLGVGVAGGLVLNKKAAHRLG